MGARAAFGPLPALEIDLQRPNTCISTRRCSLQFGSGLARLLVSFGVSSHQLVLAPRRAVEAVEIGGSSPSLRSWKQWQLMARYPRWREGRWGTRVISTPVTSPAELDIAGYQHIHPPSSTRLVPPSTRLHRQPRRIDTTSWTRS